MFALGACGQQTNSENTSAVAPALQSTNADENPYVSPGLAPAPELFEARVGTVWDGEQTLKGIWIAHPEAATARRVRLINTETGAAADGAMFRRDESVPGPPVLISSEAAVILGLSPDDETELQIVALALRAETSELAAATPAPPPATEVEAEEEDDAIEASDADNLAVAEVVTPPALTAPADVPVGALAATTPTNDAAALAFALPQQTAQAETPQTTDPSGATPPLPPEPTEPEVVAVTTEPVVLPYLQAGLFAVGDNAEALARQIRQRGFSAQTRDVQRGSRTVTQVLVGPFEELDDRNAAQDAVRALGIGSVKPVRG